MSLLSKWFGLGRRVRQPRRRVPRAARAAAPDRRRLGIDVLEDRSVPTCVAFIDPAGVLTAVGDDLTGPNVITLDHNAASATTFLCGAAFGDGSYTEVNIRPGHLGDMVNLEVTLPGRLVKVMEAAGANDIINLSPWAQFLDNIQGNVILQGNGGFHQLHLYDQNDSFPDTYTVTDSTVTRSYAAVVIYSSPEHPWPQGPVVIHGGSGDAIYNVLSTQNALVTLLPGDGVNTVNLSPVDHNLQNIQSRVVVNGSPGGRTTVNVYDDSYSFGDHYRITSTVVSYSGGEVLSYQNIQSLNLFTGAGPDTVCIESTAAGTAVSVWTGDGNDTITIGLRGWGLSQIRGPVSVDAGSGFDRLNVNDQDYDFGDTYTITNTQVLWRGPAINFSGVEALDLYPSLGGSGIRDLHNPALFTFRWLVTTPPGC
jgi:hypothetical protein